MAKFHSIAVLCVLLVCVTAQYVDVSPMPKGGRSDTSAVVAGDQIIVAGGCNAQTCSNDACLCSSVVATVEAYHPETDQWTELPSMPAPRCRHGAVFINGKVYIVGGRDVDDVVQETVFVYDTETQLWSNLTQTWPSATSDLVVVAYKNFIYAIGGYTPGYDPEDQICNFDTQQPASSWYCTSSLTMTMTRGDACGAVLDGIVYIFGGFSDYEWCLPQNSVEAFNPVTNTIEVLPRLDKPRGDSACAVVHNEFHAIGGQIKDADCLYDVPILDVEHYDPIKKDWVEETPLPAPRFRFSGASYNNIIYVFGGQASFEPATQSFPVLDSVLKWQDADSTSTASSFLTSTTTTALLIASMMALF